MIKKLIFDCDNTMGIYGKDVDDGLTLLYLFGRDDVDLLGITATFGNSTIDDVYDNTLSMIKRLNKDIPLFKGSGKFEDRRSEASRFLLDKVKNSPGEVSILATGSLTNLYGAYLMDADFFSYVKEIVVMGGIKEPLIINGKQMDELNFSSDSSAAYYTLKYGENITVITAQLCLQAFFDNSVCKRLYEEPENHVYKYIDEMIRPWFSYIGSEYDISGFYNWDIVAGVYLTNPEFFSKSIERVCSSEKDMETGYLKVSDSAQNGYKLNMPTDIVCSEKFVDTVFSTWKNAF